MVELEFPEPRIAIIVIECRFHADGIDVAVLADGCGVVCQLARRRYAAVAERILAARRHQLSIRGEGYCFAQFNVQ